jgi:hypothetical protein
VKPLRRVLLAWTIAGSLVVTAVVWGVVREPVRHRDGALVVNDVTRLNPIAVSRVIAPTTTNNARGTTEDAWTKIWRACHGSN